MQHPQGLCSLAPGYNMCILRGCSVSHLFVMVIGNQMALRQEVCLCALCFDTAGSNWYFQRWTVFETFTLGYSHAPLTSTYTVPVEQLQPFEQGCIVGMEEAGWTYWWIAAHVGHNVLLVCRCFQQWSHSEKKSGHMLHLLCHQGPLRTVCLLQDSNHMCLWSGFHLYQDTTKHGYSDVMKESTGKWNDTLLSSVMRVGSVCMQEMDIHVYCIDLVASSSRVHSPMTYRPQPRLRDVGGHQLQLVVIFGVSAG